MLAVAPQPSPFPARGPPSRAGGRLRAAAGICSVHRLRQDHEPHPRRRRFRPRRIYA